jgi:hypothetical protein
MNGTIRRTGAMIVAAGTIAAVPLLTATPALAKHGGDSAVQSRGACAGGGAFKLKAKHDDGRLEVEYEVDTNRAGLAWHITLTDNNHRIFTGDRRTAGRSGSFSVEVHPANRAGTDTIRAHASRPGHSCGGAVRV